MCETWTLEETDSTVYSFRQCNERLAATVTSFDFDTSKALLCSHLCKDIAIEILSFLTPEQATVEDLQVLDIFEPNSLAFFDVLRFDENFLKKQDSNFALLGFKHALVTCDKWQSFLRSVAESHSKHFMLLFTNHRKAREEIFPVKVWDSAFLSTVTNRNVLGNSAAKDIIHGTDFVSQLAHFVTPAFFCKLATMRQFNGLLPIHFAVLVSSSGPSHALTTEFLRSLLPHDEITAKSMDLEYTHPISRRRWSFEEFARKRYDSEENEYNMNAMAAVLTLLRTLDYD